jgi:hypothetical protein
VLSILTAPAALRAQSDQAEPDPTIRGELVRFADATVQISVFADQPAQLPDALWERLRRAGQAAVLLDGPTALNEEVRRRLEEVVGAGGIRPASQASELEPLGVHVSEADGVRLVWYGLAEDDGVAILAEARAADESFALRILIPSPNVTEEDWWGLQAALSRVGIRRVQILGGGTP